MHLVGVLYRSTWQGIKGVRWVAILSGSSRAFYSPPSFLPLRSLFLRSLQVTRRDMEIIWRIIIVLDQMRLIRHLVEREFVGGNLEIANLAASGSQVWWAILFERDENFIYLLSVLTELKIDFISSIGFFRNKFFFCYTKIFKYYFELIEAVFNFNIFDVIYNI